MTALNQKQDKNIASNRQFEVKHPNAYLIFPECGGHHGYGDETLELCFCPDTKCVFQRRLLGAAISGEFNHMGEHIPHIDAWMLLTDEEAIETLRLQFQSHRQYFPIGKWNLFDSIGKWQEQFILDCKREFGPDRVFAVDPLHHH